MQREGAVCKGGDHHTHLAEHHHVTRDGIHRHVEIGDATHDVGAEDIDRGAGDGAIAVHHLEGGFGGGRVERHCNADLLARVGRRRGDGFRNAAEGAHITGRADGEVAHDVSAQHIAHPVGDHGLGDAQLKITGRQITVWHHREALAKGAGVDGEGGGHIIGRAKRAIGPGAHQRDQRGCEQRGVDGFVKHHIEGAHQEAALAFGHVGGQHHRCKGVGHHLQCDEVGHAHIATRVGGAHLHGDAAATRHDGRDGGKQLKREGDVVGHDHAIDQQLHIAHLHVISHGGHDAQGVAFQHLDAGLAWVRVHRVNGNRQGGRNALAVVAGVVDDLHTAAAVSNKGQAVGQGHVHRHGRQVVAGQESTGVGGVSRAHHVQRLEAAKTKGAVAHHHGQARACEGDGGAGFTGIVHTGQQGQVVGVTDIGGDVTPRAAVARTDVGHTVADKQLATCGGQGQRTAGHKVVAGHAEGAQGARSVNAIKGGALERKVLQRGAADRAEVKGGTHLTRAQVNNGQVGAHCHIGQAVTHIHPGDR